MGLDATKGFLREALDGSDAARAELLEHLRPRLVLWAAGKLSSALKAQLEARKLIDRAKGVLMDKHELGEAESWRFLQKTAMNTRCTIVDVARDVISGTLSP